MAPDQIETITDATELLVDQQDVTPLGLAYQAIELQTTGGSARCRAAPGPACDEGLTDGRTASSTSTSTTRSRRRRRASARPRRRGSRSCCRTARGSRRRGSTSGCCRATRSSTTKRLSIVSGGPGDAGARGVGRTAGLRLGRGVRVVAWRVGGRSAGRERQRRSARPRPAGAGGARWPRTDAGRPPAAPDPTGRSAWSSAAAGAAGGVAGARPEPRDPRASTRRHDPEPRSRGARRPHDEPAPIGAASRGRRAATPRHGRRGDRRGGSGGSRTPLARRRRDPGAWRCSSAAVGAYLLLPSATIAVTPQAGADRADPRSTVTADTDRHRTRRRPRASSRPSTVTSRSRSTTRSTRPASGSS